MNRCSNSSAAPLLSRIISHAAIPTGESLRPNARLCGLVDWIMLNAPSRIHQSWIHAANSCSGGDSVEKSVLPSG